MIDRVRIKLCFQTERSMRPHRISVFPHQAACTVKRIELHAGEIGKHFHYASALRFPSFGKLAEARAIHTKIVVKAAAQRNQMIL